MKMDEYDREMTNEWSYRFESEYNLCVETDIQTDRLYVYVSLRGYCVLYSSKTVLD